MRFSKKKINMPKFWSQLNIKTYIFLYLFFGFLLLAGYSYTQSKIVLAGECAADECTGAGEYVCSSTDKKDDMCCTEGGCPSYDCDSEIFRNPEVCDGEWTCCFGQSCGRCDSSYVYKSRGTCEYCSGGGGNGDDDDDEPPPPPETTNIVGRIWEDKDGDNSYDDNVAETWGGASSSDACAASKSDSFGFSVNGNPATWGWGCNSKAYYEITGAPKSEHVTVNLTSPSGYTCAGVTWSYTILDSAFQPLYTKSGTGCSVYVPDASQAGLGNSWTTHLWYRLPTPNVSPTAAITAPAGAPGPITVFPDVDRDYTGTGYDLNNNLNRVELWTTKQRADGTWDYSNWTPFGSPTNWKACSAGSGTGGTCSLTRSWNPSWDLSGRYKLVVNAFDSNGLKCTGNPSVPVGWNNCGANDELTVCVRAAPTAVTPISPANGQVSVGVPVNFSWNPAQFGFSCLHNVQPTGTYTMQYRAGSSGPWTNACTSTTLTACDNVVLNKGVTYQWMVGAYNGQDTKYGGPWSFTTENATPGWFTSTGGDVYGGITGIGMVTPNTIDIRWTEAALAKYSLTIPNIAGTVQAGKKNATDAGFIRVYRDTTPDDTRISEDDRYIKNMPVKNLGFKMDGGVVVPLTPPDGAVTLNAGILGNLNPDRVYKTGNAALISGGIDYDLQKNGVTVIYLTGTAPVTITGNIKSATNANRRILLITNRDITISEDIGSPFSPGPWLLPHIEMGMVTKVIRNLPSKAPNQGLDSTVVVEGPLAA